MNIFSIDTNIPLLLEILEQSGGNIVHTFDSGNISNQVLIDTNTEFLITRSTLKVNEQLLKNSNVKFVATATTGTEHIDMDYLNRNDILFFAASGANSNSVAEYIIFSILFSFRNNINDLLTKTIGIIGYGNIGSKLAYYLDKMNIRYIICDPFLEDKFNDINFYSVDFLVENADIITLHIPLTTSGYHPTFNLINKKRIKKIKDNSILINTSRGNICDEKELLNHKNRLEYIIDTWENEPNIANKELVNNTLISTPHIAGHSYNGKLNATFMICEKLNELYCMKLNYNTSKYIQKPLAVSFDDFGNIYRILLESRKIINTSVEMKSNINKFNFSSYFNDVRKSYPQYLETLHYPLL